MSNEHIVEFRAFDKVECCFDIVVGFGNNVRGTEIATSTERDINPWERNIISFPYQL